MAQAISAREALAKFTQFFLETCLDQMNLMEDLVQPRKLRVRIKLWADEEIALGTLPARAGAVLDALLYHGELPRICVSPSPSALHRAGCPACSPNNWDKQPSSAKPHIHTRTKCGNVYMRIDGARVMLKKKVVTASALTA